MVAVGTASAVTAKLFIVRAVALEYGGTVDVESRPGEGSAFTLYLPVMDGEPQSE